MCRTESKRQPQPPPCAVDAQWLAAEGKLLGSCAGTPRRPLLAGGSGLVGSNLLVLLAHCSGVEKVRVLDMMPPPNAVTAGIEDKIEFVKGRFAAGEYERLKEAAVGCDCAFMVFTPPLHRAKLHDFYETNVHGARELTKAESVPLPPMEDYETPYDITKRMGEELIFEAAKTSPQLRACALRFGGVLLGPRDFFFDYIWPVIPGLIAVPMGKPVDWMDGRDVGRSLLIAAQGLAERPTEVNGQAFFCSGLPMTPGELARITANTLQYPFVMPPAFVMRVIVAVLRAWYSTRVAFGMSVPGVREDQIVASAFFQKTFDNTKVRKVLGFSPKVSLEDSVSRVVDLYLAEKGLKKGPALFIRFAGGCLLGTAAVTFVAARWLRAS